MARKKKKYIELWLGLLVIVGAVLTLIGYFWLTGQPLGERGYNIYMTLSDGGGLKRGDRVQLAGVEVGVVQSVELEGVERVLVKLWIEQDVALPSDSRAVLESVGVFGDQFVSLRPGDGSTTMSEGDTIRSGTTPGITDLMGDLSGQARRALGKINALLADPAIDDVHGTLESLRGALSEIEAIARANSADLRVLSSSLARTAQRLENSLEGVEVDETVRRLEDTALSMARTAESLNSSAESFESIASKIDRGEGTLGLLVNDSSLYLELMRTTESIGLLTTDIRENPGRYLKLAIF